MNAAALTTIETAQGRLAGLEKDGVLRFKGIPFAKPPVGDMRWRLPEPVEPWAGVRDATQQGPICPQAPTQLESLMGGSIGEQSEDCLYLNVWTPACDNAKRPVMVWIHGGAFVIGAGSQGIYNGRALAARDVVVVTINYRLGAFGFLDLRDATDGALPGTGSEGLADQILALHWVKQNIERFGGDPDNVTIFGESAGGMSVGSLLAAPAAKGLYHKAIAQSGAGHIGYDREKAARVAHAFLGYLDLTKADAQKLAAVPYGALIKAQIAMLAEARDGRDPHRIGRMPLQPAIDGDILPMRPIDAIRAGSAKGIALMAGTTAEEWKLFTAANAAMRLTSQKAFAARMEKLAGPEHAKAMMQVYSQGSVFDRINLVMTDKVFTIPAYRMLEAQWHKAPVHAYRVDWKSKLLGGLLGACHAIELGFVFGTFRERLAGSFFGKGPDAEALSDTMIECWTNFAKSGDPSGQRAGHWPHYLPLGNEVMIFGDGPPRVEKDCMWDRRKVWEPIADSRLGT